MMPALTCSAGSPVSGSLPIRSVRSIDTEQMKSGVLFNASAIFCRILRTGICASAPLTHARYAAIKQHRQALGRVAIIENSISHDRYCFLGAAFFAAGAAGGGPSRLIMILTIFTVVRGLSAEFRGTRGIFPTRCR